MELWDKGPNSTSSTSQLIPESQFTNLVNGNNYTSQDGGEYQDSCEISDGEIGGQALSILERRGKMKWRSWVKCLDVAFKDSEMLIF